jgi:hypothetical protein
MHDPHPTFATLIIATHPPTPEPGERQTIIGFGLLIVWKNADKTLAYRSIAGVADTLADEAQLLTELADALPHTTFLFGDNIHATIIGPLGRAVERQPSVIAAHLRQRLARFESAIQVDTKRPASPHGAAFCGELNPLTPAIIIDVFDDAIVDVEAAYDALEQRVIDDWWRFVLP